MGDDAPNLSPREAFERFLSRRQTEDRKRTVSSYRYRLKLFVGWCEEQDIESMRDLSGWDVESYDTYRRGKDLTPSTLNNEMDTLKQFFEYCARAELVDDDLPDKVDIPTVPKDAATDDIKLESERAQALLDHYRNSDDRASRGHVLLELAWYTGARAGGLRALDVRDFHPDEQYVDFRHRPGTDTPLKNGVGGERPVGLPAHVVDAVKEYLQQNRIRKRDENGRQPLLASQMGRPTTNTIRTWMYRATVPCHYGPCPHDKNPETCEWLSFSQASKCPSSRSPHPVRTGAITWMLDCGMPAEVVAGRVNSSVQVIKKHYDKADPIDEMERRRRPHLDTLSLDPDTDDS